MTRTLDERRAGHYNATPKRKTTYSISNLTGHDHLEAAIRAAGVREGGMIVETGLSMTIRDLSNLALGAAILTAFSRHEEGYSSAV